jgi:YD repeat-containing protein
LLDGILVLVFLATLLSAPAFAGTATYTYDVQGRLTAVTYSTGVVITYSYDATGNRTSVVTTGVP